jgi:multicomponent Na+:H+ antiporter subunit F
MLELIIAFVIACSVLSIGMALHRMALGPTQADRIVALEILLAGGLALAIGASLVTQRTVFLDVGIGLALVGFVATIGWARLLERSMADTPQPPHAR